MGKLPAHQNWDDVLKAVPPVSGGQVAPQVLFTKKPAELIAFVGKPVYSKIPGTSLSYATNTENKVFVHQPDGQVYVLISGRWFRAASLAGPWSYASNSLPADFAMIPRSSLLIIGRSWFVVWLLLLLPLCGSAHAQVDQGAITGIVRDPSGAAIPNAKVTITSKEAGLALQRQSNESGVYVFSPLKIGNYKVSATANGGLRGVAFGGRVVSENKGGGGAL